MKIKQWNTEIIEMGDLSRGELFTFYAEGFTPFEKPHYVVISITKKLFVFEATTESGFGRGERELPRKERKEDESKVMRFTKRQRNQNAKQGILF